MGNRPDGRLLAGSEWELEGQGMAGRSNDDIFEAIGGLKASIDGIRREMQAAHDAREKISDKLDKQSGEMTDQSRRIGHLEHDMAAMKPVVQEWSQLKIKAGGAVVVLTVIGAVLGAVATIFIAEIKAGLYRLLGYP